jgi:uncharacterized lipoprotein YbaY
MPEEERGRTSVPLVKVHILLDKNVKLFSRATIYIRLEDVGMQDAPSTTIYYRTD